MVAIPDPKLGPRKVDIPSMYNTERYRPRYDHKLGLPIFLTRPQCRSTVSGFEQARQAQVVSLVTDFS